MKCSNCGKEVPERAIVCGYCGEEQAQPAAKAPEPAPEKVVPVEKVDVAPKPAPKKAGPTEKAVSAQPSELPGWVIPAGLGAVALILVVVMLSGRSPQPGAVSSEAVQKELVYVHWDCEEEYVSAEDEIALYYNWTVLEEEQIGDYFSVVEHHVTINGDPVSILADGYGEIEQDGEGFFMQRYWMNLGSMAPGEYEITTFADITEQVFDGWDWYGPDMEMPSFSQDCVVIVS